MDMQTFQRRYAIFALLAMAWPAIARGDAPSWMHAVVNSPLPPHDEKTNAVLLYSEDILNVQGNGKIKETERFVYKILRPDGRKYGTVYEAFDSETKITGLRGWCIPAQGKDYEVKDKDAVESSFRGYGELATDIREKILHIPGAEPGNIIGYEIERERRPYILQDEWAIQRASPVHETRYTLQLPPGWEYKAVFVNFPELKSAAIGNNQWQWVANDIEAIRFEDDMPPWTAVAGQMIVSFFAPGASVVKGFDNWNDMALWEAGLMRGRRDSSPEIKQKVTALTPSGTSQLAKMRTLAKFVQSDIRYVAIELGIGGWQPHAAKDVFTHHFGDCKDKATLLSTMLKEIGVDSYYIIVNTQRGTVNSSTPAVNWFNHVILAVRLPESVVADSSLVSVYKHPSLGSLLIFDPTDDLTPFGHLRGPLQANYGLLVSDSGGELIELPKLPPTFNTLHRSAKLTLSASGNLTGDVKEVRSGDPAAYEREFLRRVSSDKDRIKSIETLLSHSLGSYRITKASVTNAKETDQPFQFNFSLVSENYAKIAGNLLLVRPRVLGTEASGLLETKEARKFPVEFEGPSLSTNSYEITLPAGYEVDELPPPVDADFGFATYHSKTEATGNVLRYSRTYEVKDVSVPLSKVEDLKKLYRIIASDERSTAVLKPKGS